jgi:hypothetical protein
LPKNWWVYYEGKKIENANTVNSEIMAANRLCKGAAFFDIWPRDHIYSNTSIPSFNMIELARVDEVGHKSSLKVERRFERVVFRHLWPIRTSRWWQGQFFRKMSFEGKENLRSLLVDIAVNRWRTGSGCTGFQKGLKGSITKGAHLKKDKWREFKKTNWGTHLWKRCACSNLLDAFNKWAQVGTSDVGISD